MVPGLDPNAPMFAQFPRNAETDLHFPFSFAKTIRPLGRMRKIEGPFPIAATLTQDDLLLQLGLAVRDARLQIKRQPNLMIGGVPQHVTVFERNAIELRMMHVVAGSRLAKIGETFIHIQRQRVVSVRPYSNS